MEVVVRNQWTKYHDVGKSLPTCPKLRALERMIHVSIGTRASRADGCMWHTVRLRDQELDLYWHLHDDPLDILRIPVDSLHVDDKTYLDQV